MNNQLIERVAAGDVTAVARAISKVEESAPDSSDLMKQIFLRTGRALVVGITGAPGAGKSSLVDKLAAFYRKQGASRHHRGRSFQPVFWRRDPGRSH